MLYSFPINYTWKEGHCIAIIQLIALIQLVTIQLVLCFSLMSALVNFYGKKLLCRSQYTQISLSLCFN